MGVFPSAPRMRLLCVRLRYSRREPRQRAQPNAGLRRLRAGGPSRRTRVDPLAEVWESDIIPTDPLAGRSPVFALRCSEGIHIVLSEVEIEQSFFGLQDITNWFTWTSNGPTAAYLRAPRCRRNRFLMRHG
jgi:hypothetical protein